MGRCSGYPVAAREVGIPLWKKTWRRIVRMVRTRARATRSARLTQRYDSFSFPFLYSFFISLSLSSLPFLLFSPVLLFPFFSSFLSLPFSSLFLPPLPFLSLSSLHLMVTFELGVLISAGRILIMEIYRNFTVSAHQPGALPA